MKKSGVLFFVLFLVVFSSGVSAISITNTTVNSTLRLASVQDAVELYAYEVNFDYSGTGTLTSTNAQFFRFFGSGITSGVNQKDTTVSVYESILNSTHLGVNGSGNLFNISYPNGNLTLESAVLVFGNGTEMTIDYTTGEVSVTENPRDSGGGGGLGGAPVDPISLSETLLSVETFPGENVWKEIRISNNRLTEANIQSIEIQGLDGILEIDEESIRVPGKEYKDVVLKFNVPKSLEPDVYTGRVLFSTEDFTAILNIVLEVQLVEGALFDVIVNLPNGNEFGPGEVVVAEIEVDNFGNKRGFDFDLFYAIKDFQGRTLSFGEENIAIETKVELIRELQLPSDVDVGQYVFTAKASHEDAVASGSKTFSVVGVALSPFSGNVFLVVLGVAALVALIVVIVVVLHARGKRERE